MLRHILLVTFALALSASATAQMTNAQKTTFAAHIRANTDPVVVAARAIRDDGTIAAWYNTAGNTDAWRVVVSGADTFEATPITQFDGLTAGKRDAWRLMVDQSQVMPLDFSKVKVRNAVVDIWAAPQATTILTGATEKALRVEEIFGGPSQATGGVTAIRRNYVGAVTVTEVSIVLNQF